MTCESNPYRDQVCGHSHYAQVGENQLVRFNGHYFKLCIQTFPSFKYLFVDILHIYRLSH